MHAFFYTVQPKDVNVHLFPCRLFSEVVYYGFDLTSNSRQNVDSGTALEHSLSYTFLSLGRELVLFRMLKVFCNDKVAIVIDWVVI